MGQIFSAALGLCLWVISGESEAQTRDAWLRSYQAKDSEFSGFYGYRVCKGRHLNFLEKQQVVLLKKLAARFAEPCMLCAVEVRPQNPIMRNLKGGESKGDPCEAFAFHGFNGLEREVVQQTATWILAK